MDHPSRLFDQLLWLRYAGFATCRLLLGSAAAMRSSVAFVHGNRPAHTLEPRDRGR